MATVYSQTLTGATEDSSGSLSVSSYNELWVALDVSAVDWTGSASATLSRIDAFSTLFPMISVQLGEGHTVLDVGSGMTTNLAFGDHVQLDISTVDGTTISAQVSIIGK